MGFTVIRMRSIHRPEVLPEPAAVLVDSHDDSENTGGEHEVGGFHIMEVHINTLVGASGVFFLLIVVGIMCYLCHKDLLQACCGACCQACWGFAGPREHPVIQGESVSLGLGGCLFRCLCLCLQSTWNMQLQHR